VSVVHALLSLHVGVLVSVLTHAPVAGLHVSVVHALLSLHVGVLVSVLTLSQLAM
jgi:hypothetical protein